MVMNGVIEIHDLENLNLDSFHDRGNTLSG